MAQSKWHEILGLTSAEERESRRSKDLVRLVAVMLFAVGIASLPWGNAAIGLIIAMLGATTFCVTLRHKTPQ
ncbi:hypothetical protein [Arthrobacter sp. M4]|uniref:hypothetical protein n=1 Tax=Arthrobacter sp. M4 TaxID=218160 RepID=UPI001CDC4E21|nr:hypothetical protein [Arthrobacter sp. M4]MCA4133188.1 hypothetical protein [Arthrobacter sp. M4]